MKVLSLVLLAVVCHPVLATDIYHWVDENGVQNFSEKAPAGLTESVVQLALEDTAPLGYDPDDDFYNVKAQQERMQALREEMEAKREERAEQRRHAARQPLVQYREPYGYSRPLYWNPPYYPRPPIHPRPPVPAPYETATFAPPGRLSN